MVRRHWTDPNTAMGRPPVADEIQALIVRLATENPRWGYQRIKGELAGPDYQASASSVRRVLRAHGVGPAPRRASTTWSAFIGQQASAIVACDFFTVDSVWLTRYHVLFFIEVEARRVHLLGTTTNPTGEWVTQQAGHLASNLDEAGRVVAHVIRDREAKFTRSFDEVWRSVGAEVIRTPVRAPNANASLNAGSGPSVGNASTTSSSSASSSWTRPRHLRRALQHPPVAPRPRATTTPATVEASRNRSNTPGAGSPP
jgi:hypothetical protein